MIRADRDILYYIKTYCVDVQDMMERFGADYAVFQTDKVYRYACAMCIVQMGMLAESLSEQYRGQSSLVDWDILMDARNFFSDNSGMIDTYAIWSIITNDVPKILKVCKEDNID